jgi:hypothetical protein
MKLNLFVLVLAVLLFPLVSCNLSSEQQISVFSFSFDFSTADQGWTGDFADYPEGDSIGYELLFKHDTLPTNLNQNKTKKALLISGNNGSDDLFMFVKRKLSGLRPNATYELLFNIQLASNAPTNAVGVGGAPGESVYLKVGATLEEPKKELDVDNMLRMNIDKGNQSEDGEDMIVIGHVGVAPTTTQYASISRNNNSTSSFIATTDSNGELWLIVGTDSGFEGTTTLYYMKIDVLFNQLD